MYVEEYGKEYDSIGNCAICSVVVNGYRAQCDLPDTTVGIKFYQRYMKDVTTKLYSAYHVNRFQWKDIV